MGSQYIKGTIELISAIRNSLITYNLKTNFKTT